MLFIMKCFVVFNLKTISKLIKFFETLKYITKYIVSLYLDHSFHSDMTSQGRQDRVRKNSSQKKNCFAM